MRKVANHLKSNILLYIILFLLAFIPLYPKIPLLDISHTWVYIRIEDFLVLGVVLFFGLMLLFRKVTIRTPLTIPILAFWGVGAISTIYAIAFVFPNLTNVFPQLAVLHYLRRIEYLILFFVAFSAIRSKKSVPYIVGLLVITTLIVVGYGIGQRYLGFPAFLTGNEEFAKGAPLRISSAGRIPSTFAGHYDLAAWLVIMIPLFGAMIFAFKNWFVKFALFFAGFGGLILLLMTASRVSFLVYLVVISFMLFIVKQKKFIIPVLILSLLVSTAFEGMTQRFGSTISQVDLVVDARTGKAIGVAKDIQNGEIVIEEKQQTGEDLPEGSGFINLPTQGGSPSSSRVVIKRTEIKEGVASNISEEVEGSYIVKKGLAYDVSFTTRFQGTWPRAIRAFERSPILGSGYSSISLASDNNYLRILGEVGILGMGAFLLIFLVYSIYLYRVLPSIDSKPVRYFVLGISAGIFGILLNAVLIDVFEASKVAFPLWILIGITVGYLHLYQKKKVHIISDLFKTLTSVPAIGVYLLIATFAFFSVIFKNYFVADDFTWLRWAADCKKVLFEGGITSCEPATATIRNFFLDSDGFFYRPGTKLYFYLAYPFFYLNVGMYHVVSILAHFATTLGVYIIALRVLKSKVFAMLSAASFLVLAVHFESILWISVTGHLVASASTLCGLIAFMYWRQTRHFLLLVLSLLFVGAAPLFHEFGVVAPFVIIFYSLIFGDGKHFIKRAVKWDALLMLLPIPFYIVLRFVANSHWSGGDYSYNLLNLPFNAIGNFFGYIGIILLGTHFMEPYQIMRESARENILLTAFVLLAIGAVVVVAVRFKRTRAIIFDKVVLFSVGFFIITLLPFLGLGNIAYRYAYLPSVAVVIVFSYILMKVIGTKHKVQRTIGTLVVVGIAMAYMISNYMQFLSINKEWKAAGEITYNAVVGLFEYFPASNATPKNPVFYFANTPGKYENTWVFPDNTLENALWFSFQNENLTVRLVPDLDTGFSLAEGSLSARIFEFTREGVIEEVAKQKPLPQK